MNKIKICETEKGTVEYFLKGNGTTVLIVHGGHDSCRGDYMNDNLLENNFSVLIPTRPGYRGTPISSGKTAKDTADLFASLLKKLGIKKVFLIGNSAGGPVALEFAKLYPEIVEKLVLEAAVVKPWFHRLTVQYYGVKVIFNPKNQGKFWNRLKEKLDKNPKKTLLDNIKLFTKLNPQKVLDMMSNQEIEVLKTSMVTGNDSGEGFIYDVEHRAKDIDQINCPTLIIHSK
nr:alpha/beta fold hydrolase [Spirochaetota bacterium]